MGCEDCGRELIDNESMEGICLDCWDVFFKEEGY
mgnify:CR=1 FL=1